MTGKSTSNKMEQKNKHLEKEVLEYVRKVKELSKERKVIEYGHIRRTLSLMHILRRA